MDYSTMHINHNLKNYNQIFKAKAMCGLKIKEFAIFFNSKIAKWFLFENSYPG